MTQSSDRNSAVDLVIFDLDGVLVEARELHYEAMNQALEAYDPAFVIHRDEHLAIYDGLPTRNKLVLLSERKGLPPEAHEQIWRAKQDRTQALIAAMRPDPEKRAMLGRLKAEGYKIYCASNSIKATLESMLGQRGLLPFFDGLISNQDVRHAKPNPEMFLRAMVAAGVGPSRTVIVEDSNVGREAARRAGAHVCAVENAAQTTYERVREAIDAATARTTGTRRRWQGGKMNVLVPMAGAGSRFQKAGYTFPKPLIDVNGKPMIQTVVDNLAIDARHVFVVQKAHYEQYNLHHLLNLVAPGCEIVQVEGLTQGAACTTLLAKEFIDNDEPLLMANSDQYVEWDSSEFMYAMTADEEIDGGILSFTATHPKWSFAKTDAEGFVTEVAEKKPISDVATVGVYYWRKGSDYVRFAERMIERDVRVNNEFYVCPVFNQAIESGKKIKTFHVDEMWGLGTPEDLDRYLRFKAHARKAA